ncbi:MAG: ScyD/ScyE family protein [Thermomicrobium sp.]|nr:ScyD/ScyE family protein [Thermomicrobium sp.]
MPRGVRTRHALLLVAALAAALALPPSAGAQPAGSACREFPETGHAVCHGFLAYWNQFGGLPLFGYPLTDEMTVDGTVVQYFERARFEWHPGVAPDRHDVLLGLLGTEQTDGWRSVPPFQPAAARTDARYFPQTGHNIAGPFRTYWETAGGLPLFGYPLSEPYTDHGTTIQYFERARFELHPGASPRTADVLLGLLGAEQLRARTLETVATGLRNPRGIAVAPDGTIYVAEAGNGGNTVCIPGPEGSDVCFGNSGAIVRIRGGSVERPVTGLPSLASPDGRNAVGPQDAIVAPDGTLYVLVGLGADPADRARLPSSAAHLGQLLRIALNGTLTVVADLAAYEATHDPDGAGPDSNPYAMLLDGDRFVVVDAGANALLGVTMDGSIETLAVFPPFMTPAPPFLNLPPGTEIPAQSVPTSVVEGTDGAYYVSELTGFPFPVGAARLWRVVPGQEPEVVATGFTDAIDLAVGPDGSLVVLEIATYGLLAAQQGIATGFLGQLAADGTVVPILPNGLVTPTAFARLPDGTFVATDRALSGDAARLVRIQP